MDSPTRCRELSELVAAAGVVPPGFAVRPVGVLPALTFLHIRDGEFWMTADLADGDGVGHLEVSVCADRADMPGIPEGAVEWAGADGSVTHVWSASGPGGVAHSMGAVTHEDGSYVWVRSSNQSSTATGPTRPDPPVAANEVLVELGELRP